MPVGVETRRDIEDARGELLLQFRVGYSGTQGQKVRVNSAGFTQLAEIQTNAGPLTVHIGYEPANSQTTVLIRGDSEHRSR